MTDTELPQPKRSNQQVVRMWGAGIAIVLIIVLGVVKASNPNFSLKSFLLSAGGVIVFFGAVIFGFYFFEKRKTQQDTLNQAGKIPPAVTTEQARDLAENLVQGRAYGDYMELDREYSQQYGKGIKSWIYTYVGNGKYQKVKYYVVLNMHRPLEKFTILTDPTVQEWEFVKNSMADYPDPTPDVKETVVENPLLGTRQVTREIIKNDDSKKDDKKDGDL